MGRPRTGTAIAKPDGTFSGRVTLADGTQSHRFPLPNARTLEEAKAMVLLVQLAEDREHSFLIAKTAAKRGVKVPEATLSDAASTDAWFARYIALKECGEGHRRISRSAWKCWISPVIGALPIATLSREDVERVRDHIDAAVKVGKMSGSTPINVWSTLTAALTAAFNAKDRTLRVHGKRERPLHDGVLPPSEGESRSRPWLYPNELVALVSCETIDFEWRRTYALAAFLGLRPNELRALTFGDVDLEVGLVHVTRAWNPETRKVDRTKTEAAVRAVPIHDEIRPLLARPPGRSGSALVVDIPWRKIAERFRAHLMEAGVRRPRLHTVTAKGMRIDFRALRDTYATWSALAGKDAFSLRREMGHEDLATTDGYIREAQSFRGANVGKPFPALAFGQSSGQTKNQEVGDAVEKLGEFVAPTVGLETSAAGLEWQNIDVSSSIEAKRADFGGVKAGFTPGPHSAEMGLYGWAERVWSKGGDA